MNWPGLTQLRQTKHWIRNRLHPAGLILMYHRVADISPDPFHLCVSPDHFAQQLAVIQHQCHPLPLAEFVQATQQGTLPQRAVAITFDDGYADNLYAAKPLLEAYNIPATVFIATGNLTQQREAWWDELEKIFLQPGQLPATLSLILQGQPYQWELGEAAEYDPDAWNRDRTWSWYDPPSQDPTLRQHLYRSLYDLLHSMTDDERQSVMDQLLAWAGMPPTQRSDYRFLSATEVPQLAAGELIEIGAHTVNHPFLATLPLPSQQQEIAHSKHVLEDLIHHPIRSFAYPHGNYRSDTIGVVQDTGFTCACTTQADSVRSPVDRFQLPRMVVQNWDGDTFAQQMINWFHN